MCATGRAARCPPTCATPTTVARRRSATATATATRTTIPAGWVAQQYRPAALADRVYYEPSPHGDEAGGRATAWPNQPRRRPTRVRRGRRRMSGADVGGLVVAARRGDRGACSPSSLAPRSWWRARCAATGSSTTPSRGRRDGDPICETRRTAPRRELHRVDGLIDSRRRVSDDRRLRVAADRRGRGATGHQDDVAAGVGTADAAGKVAADRDGRATRDGDGRRRRAGTAAEAPDHEASYVDRRRVSDRCRVRSI